MYIRLPLSSRYPGALSNVLRQVTGLRELCKSKLDGSDKVCTGQTDSVNIIMWVSFKHSVHMYNTLSSTCICIYTPQLQIKNLVK